MTGCSDIHNSSFVIRQSTFIYYEYSKPGYIRRETPGGIEKQRSIHGGCGCGDSGLYGNPFTADAVGSADFI